MPGIKKNPYKYKYLMGSTQKSKLTGIQGGQNIKHCRLIHANGKWVAFQNAAGSSGNGKIFDERILTRSGGKVIRANDLGERSIDNQTINGHKGGIADFRFHPFNLDLIATAGDDATLKEPPQPPLTDPSSGKSRARAPGGTPGRSHATPSWSP